MPRFKLRTLLIVLALGPPILGLIAWPEIQARYRSWQARPELQTIDSPGSGDFGFVSGLQKNTAASSGIFGDNGNHIGPILDEDGRVPAKPIVLIGP